MLSVVLLLIVISLVYRLIISKDIHILDVRTQIHGELGTLQVESFRFLVEDSIAEIEGLATHFCILHNIIHDFCRSLIDQSVSKALYFNEKCLITKDKMNDNNHLLSNKMNDSDTSSQSDTVCKEYQMDHKNYVFVTSYYDINREQYDNRSSSDYMKYFGVLVRMNIPLVVFIDDRYYDHAIALIRQHRSMKMYTSIHAINDRFLRKHIRSWSYVSIEHDIMHHSVSYRELISHRPEVDLSTYLPEYNCINHAKIDFIQYAIEQQLMDLNMTHYIGWIDFGYLRNDWEVFPFELNPVILSDHLNVCVVRDFVESDRNYSHLLATSTAPIGFIITGNFWIGSIYSLKRYHRIYHDCLHILHSMEIADDDQTVMICCYFTDPSMFRLWKMPRVFGLPDTGVFASLILFNKLFADNRSLYFHRSISTFLDTNYIYHSSVYNTSIKDNETYNRVTSDQNGYYIEEV